MIHQRVAVDERPLHLNQLDVVVAQGQSVVENVAVRLLASLTVAVLADHILNSVDLVTTMVGINDNVSASAVRRLHHRHHLGCSLRISSLPVYFRFFFFNLLLLLLILRRLAVARLLWRDHGRDNVTNAPIFEVFSVLILAVARASHGVGARASSGALEDTHFPIGVLPERGCGLHRLSILGRGQLIAQFTHRFSHMS